MKYYIEFDMDGYETEEEHREAAREYIDEQLNSSGTYLKVIELPDDFELPKGIK